jgi:hypothetical protein
VQELVKMREGHAQSNKAHVEETEALRKEQRESQPSFARDLANLKQQLA